MRVPGHDRPPKLIVDLSPVWEKNMAYTDSQIMMTLAAITYAPAKDIGSYLLPTTNPPNATNGEWAVV